MGALRWLLALALWLPVAPDEVFSMELEKDGGILRLEVPKTSDAAAVGVAVRAFIAAHDLVEGMGCDDAACIQDVVEAAVNEGLAGATDTAEDAGEAAVDEGLAGATDTAEDAGASAVVELERDGATLALRAPRAGGSIRDAVRAFVAAHDLAEGMGCDDAGCVRALLERALADAVADARCAAAPCGPISAALAGARRADPLYDVLLAGRRDATRAVLAAGADGAALKAWADVFPRAAVVGLADDPRAAARAADLHDRVRVLPAAGAPAALRALAATGGPGAYDVVVASGGAAGADGARAALRDLWPFVAPGGLLLLERLGSRRAALLDDRAALVDILGRETPYVAHDGVLVVRRLLGPAAAAAAPPAGRLGKIATRVQEIFGVQGSRPPG